MLRKEAVYNLQPTWPPFHVFGFNPKALGVLLEKHGFRIESLRVHASTQIRSSGGLKDTVICYPGEVTRIRGHFDTPGQFVWHCHIVEHEDNEMMRPYRIGPVQPGQPGKSM